MPASLLTVGTAIFVAVEFSLVALDRPTVQRAIDAGDRRAEVVLGSLRRLSTQLSAAQVGITLTTLVLGYLATPSIGRLLETPLSALGLSGGTLTSVAATLALVIATLFSMVFGELLPQFLGISAPLATAKVVAMPVRVFAVVAKPLIYVLNGSANLAPAGHGHHAPGGAVRRAHPAGARLAGAPVCRAGHARRGHCPAGDPLPRASASRPRPT